MAALLKRAFAGVWPGASGPAVAAVFQRLLALVFLIAWVSLGWQVRTLIGERGLIPLWAFLEEARAEMGLLSYPSLLRWQWAARDGVLIGGMVLGVALAVVALVGIRARLCLGLSTALYLSYTVACRSFLAFQWDNLLLECGFLAVFLPSGRAAPVAHLLFRLVAFKLYFESGIAKWQSPIRDWHDGSAMTFYYETAPLPTLLGWYAHNLPAWWHHLESRATLVLELGVPFAMFGPRRARLVAAGALSAFQLINAATGNYGFFCYLALGLHLFLLEDRDIPRRLLAWLRHREVEASTRFAFLARARLAGLGAYLFLSLLSAWSRFGERVEALAPVRRLFEPFRVINTYHLFASVTRERIEPELQVMKDGQWIPLHLRHKPGDPARAPGFVAPHQPRVDFLLWFHGLSYQRHPLYVMALVQRLCGDRPAVRPLFRTPVPSTPEAVRLAYWRYNFTTRAERRETGAWWKRTLVDETPAVRCTP